MGDDEGRTFQRVKGGRQEDGTEGQINTLGPVTQDFTRPLLNWLTEVN